MRRFVLLCLMLILPLQWSWAARFCQHAQAVHHHHAAQGEEEKAAVNAPSLQLDADCVHCHCHDHTAAAIVSPTPWQPVWMQSAQPPGVRGWIPDPSPDNLLRPPIACLARDAGEGC